MISSVASHVLVVDDDPHIRGFIHVLLEDSGFQVSEAADGRQALADITASRPALVLLDIQMPVMDGIQVIEQLRDTRALVPVVVMTAGLRARQIAVTYGTAGYLEKPFDIDRLLDLVHGILGPHDGRS